MPESRMYSVPAPIDTCFSPETSRLPLGITSITVTVIEVLGNGNLLVSGEKQVSIGAGTEYIRLSGIINPYFINAANSISSGNVADARIEYKEAGVISEAQVMGWLARFFMSVLPF